MSLLEITGLTHTFGETALYKNAALTLNKGEHMGVVGQNGAGKSTLVKICTGQTIPDEGRVAWQPGVTLGYLDQYAALDPATTMRAFLRSAFARLYAVEAEMNAQYTLAAAGDEAALAAAAQCQDTLDQSGFYELDTRIEQVAGGLGLLALGLERPIAKMSGGQRAKVILAKLLLQKPDVLLLDEPTNFLDKEHVAWLAEHLAGLPNAYLVVSHDYAFLDKIANRICDIDNLTLHKYFGSYAAFTTKKALLREDYIRQYAAQQKEIKKTEAFIRKNIAGQNSKMARGRQKQLAHMDKLEALDQKEIRPSFHFTALPLTTTKHLTAKGLAVGYHYPLLSGIELSVKGGQKVVVTGFNGIGKSTLLNTLMGRLPPLQGSFAFAGQVTTGYFSQDLQWQNGDDSPLATLTAAYPRLTAKEARKQLARCGIPSHLVLQPVRTLSGGEQAKLKLCLLIQHPCNFLILDEPTNHLDIQAKAALQTGLIEFPGTVLLVSHEELFYRAWADRVIRLEKA